MSSVLFICTGNIYRSPLSAAFFLKQLQQAGQESGWRAESAGTWTVPGQTAPADVLDVASRYDVDLKKHVTRLVDRELLEAFDLILVMERGHKEALAFEFPSISGKLHLLSDAADHLIYDIPDPATSDLGLDEIADQLFKLIERGYQDIYELAQAAQFPRL